jgi:ABC-2 type transport system ATP-binding protein
LLGKSHPGSPYTPRVPIGSAAVEVRGLTVRFAGRAAVDALDLTVPSHALTVLLGPNGAGKSTTLDVCEGLRRADAGTVRVLGTDPWRADARHRAQVGVMLQRAGQPSGFTARDALRAAADLFAEPRSVSELSALMRLDELGRTPFRRLSGGEQQRVGLAVALVGRPALLLLDEPTAGMDPALRREVWDLLREEVVGGASVLVTTHQIDEAAEHAEHVLLMARGRLVAHGAPAELAPPGQTVTFSAAPGLNTADLAATALEVREEPGGRYEVRSVNPGALDTVVAWAGVRGHALSDLATSRSTLEDAVLNLVDWAGPR